MKETKYKIELQKVLNENSQESINKLNSVIPLIPEKTRSVQIIIFPDQDGEGTFGVRVVLDGPDLFVLNKVIKDFADIIDVVHTPKGLVPPVPLMDPFNSKFEVNDVLSDVVGEWVGSIWGQINSESITVPITLVSDDGWGTIFPKSLSANKASSKEQIFRPNVIEVKPSFWNKVKGFFK